MESRITFEKLKQESQGKDKKYSVTELNKIKVKAKRPLTAIT